MNYPVSFNLSYNDFIKQVKNIHSCSAFFIGEGYKRITEEIRNKIKNGELIITEYHDEPLGEVIYLSPSSILQ
jgi:hypothetical protein